MFLLHSNQSTKINAQRLRVLQAREKVLDSVSAEAHQRLASLTSNAETYKKLLADLILQGLFGLMENNATVIARKADASLVQGVLGDVKKRYEAASKKTITLALDTEVLPAESTGGVILSTNGGRIRSNNTLDARLELIFQAVRLPLLSRCLAHR